MDTEERLDKLRQLQDYLEQQLQEGGVSEPARVASQYRQTLAEIAGLEAAQRGGQPADRCQCLTIASALGAAYDERGTHPDHRLDWTEIVGQPDFVDRVVNYLVGHGELHAMRSRVAARAAAAEWWRQHPTEPASAEDVEAWTAGYVARCAAAGLTPGEVTAEAIGRGWSDVPLDVERL